MKNLLKASLIFLAIAALVAYIFQDHIADWLNDGPIPFYENALEKL